MLSDDLPDPRSGPWRAGRSADYVAAVYDTAQRVNDMHALFGGEGSTTWNQLTPREQHNRADWVELHLSLHQQLLAERTNGTAGGRHE